MYETHGDENRGSVVALAMASTEPGSATSGAMLCACAVSDVPSARQIIIKILVSMKPRALIFE